MSILRYWAFSITLVDFLRFFLPGAPFPSALRALPAGWRGREHRGAPKKLFGAFLVVIEDLQL